MSGLLWRTLMAEVEVMSVQVLLGISKSADRWSVWLESTIKMLNTFAWRLIIESILSKLIVMLSHYPNVLDALLLALSLIWVVTSLKWQFCDSIDDRASWWSADAPVSQTKTIFDIGINICALIISRMILESGLVLCRHLELLIDWVAQTEMRVLWVAWPGRWCRIVVLINVWGEGPMVGLLGWLQNGWLYNFQN